MANYSCASPAACKAAATLQIEIINTGSELMLGRHLNTHAQWLCARLTDLGHLVARQTAVDDTGPAILGAISEALPRADLIITTGGLGPTSDDRTRDLIADLLGLALHEDADALAGIEHFFTSRRRTMPENTRRQAWVPGGALVLNNAYGTAPGLAIPPRAGAPNHRSWLIMLPGPPRELHPMFLNQVVPLIKKQFPLPASFVSRTLRTTGIGESYLEERIAAPLQPLVDAGLEIAYCARPGEVDLRLAMQGTKGEAIVAEAETIVRRLVEPYIFGLEGDSLERTVVAALLAKQKTVAVAESCTGGLLGHRFTNVPGASATFLGGVIAYSNEAKKSLLQVRPQTLEAHGAVSEAVVREMAEGARTRFGTDYALAVSGIAGPAGGTEDKPVGTVFLGLASADGTNVQRQLNPYDRETFKEVTVQQALEMLRRALGRGK